MNALWLFYTIVLGAAFAQISLSMAVQWKIHAATGERLYLPTFLWLGFLLILTVEAWVALGDYQRTTTSMSVLSMLAFLWVPLGVFTLSIFLAEPTWNGTAPADDEERFTRLRGSFFTVLLLIPGINLLHEFFLGSVGFDSDLAFAALLILGALIGFRIRTRTADSILAGAMIVVISTYLFLEYGTISAIPS